MSFNPKTHLSIDTETTGVHPWLGHQPFAVSLADQDLNTWFCHWDVDPFTRKVYPAVRDLRFLGDLFRDPRLEKWFWNRPFDLLMLRNVGLMVEHPIHDGLNASRCVHTNELNYGLKPITKKYAGIPDDDKKALQSAVVRGRNRARKLGWNIATEETHGKGFTGADYWIPRTLDPEDRTCEKYARLDAVRTLIMGRFYSEICFPEEPVYQATYEAERSLWKAVGNMEGRGICVNLEQVRREIATFEAESAESLATMLAIIDRDDISFWGKTTVAFNPNSTEQIRRILYDHYGLEPLEPFTDSGLPGTGWESIAPYAERCDFIRPYLKHQRAKQALSHFFGRYERFAVPDDDLNPGGHAIHCHYKQDGTRTFRLSAVDPNLTNVSNSDTAARSYDPFQARHVFGPRPGYAWYKFDYAQQEIRIFAHVSQSKPMLETLRSGGDINSANANRLWGNLSENGGRNPYAAQNMAYALELGATEAKVEVTEAWKVIGWDPDLSIRYGVNSREALAAGIRFLSEFEYDITLAEAALGKKNSRTRAKNCFYANLYGSGPKGLSTMLKCLFEEAADALERWNEIFPEVRLTSRRIINEIRRNGYVENIYGDRMVVDPGYEYKGINYAVQGSAARMMKDSLIRVENYLEGLRRRRLLDLWLLLTVHDELDTEIRREHERPWIIRGIKAIMEDNNDRVSVPMTVEIERIDSTWNAGVKVNL